VELRAKVAVEWKLSLIRGLRLCVAGHTVAILPLHFTDETSLTDLFSITYASALSLPFRESGATEGIMQMAITFMAVVGGLIFSLAVALLAEELIFGQVFRLFFAPQKLAAHPMAVKSASQR
jgi:hypothetical protein